jgi:dihydrofolate reductase
VLVTARRTFDIAHAWGGKHPMGVPMVVVTHRVPQERASREGSPFMFVTGGVPKASGVAREIAGGKDVVVGAPSVTQQCLELGLLDAIRIDLAPVVLGRGIRLFDDLTRPVELLVTEASGNPARHAHHLPGHQVAVSHPGRLRRRPVPRTRHRHPAMLAAALHYSDSQYWGAGVPRLPDPHIHGRTMSSAVCAGSILGYPASPARLVPAAPSWRV